jgi:NAD(P)-dependent dehydrogenase (short-subunit alcohol dehydrogenase family)
MIPRLDGCRAVVTGGGSGLGRALVLALARRSARVVVADVDRAGAEETARLARAENPAAGEDSALVFPCDVSSAESVGELAAFSESRLGAVDFLANNAGVAVGGEVGAVSLEDWRFVVGVNLWGVVHGCHAFVPLFRSRKRGAILNVASAAGLLAPPRLAPYNVTKAAVVALSETLFTELRDDGIGVTVLCPTFFRTRILDSSRGVSDEKQRAAVGRLMDASKLQAPEVAQAALAAVERGRLYAVPMTDGRLFWALKRAMPAAFHRLMATSIARRRFDA